MKNNTKLIMETWRRFLNESPYIDEPGSNEPEFESEVAPQDEDLSSELVSGAPESLESDMPAEEETSINFEDPQSEEGSDLVFSDDYSQADAAMSAEERRLAGEERLGDNDPDFEVDEENPFADDTGPY